jgi:hypothetical protein
MVNGKWIRRNTKSRVEQLNALDIRRMNLRHPFLTICIYPNRRQANYFIRNDALHIETHNQVIQFVKTPCHFGGERYWFQCPQCSRHVVVIYEKQNKFLCRHCHNLSYTSQVVADDDRLRLKARKLRDRLGATHNLSVPITERPKGMHRNTFLRLRYAELVANYDSIMAMAKALKLSIGSSR